MKYVGAQDMMVKFQNLLSCDLDPYDERYFLSPQDGSKLAGGAVACSNPSSCDCGRQREDAPPSPPASFPPSSRGSPRSLPLMSTAPSSEFCSIALDEAERSSAPSTLTSRAAPIVLDIRPREHYTRGPICGAWSVPMAAAPADLFGDAQAVEERWREIQHTIDGPRWPGPSELQELPALVLCNNGDSGRMTVAILRARGVKAFTIEGGYDALAIAEGCGKQGM